MFKSSLFFILRKDTEFLVIKPIVWELLSEVFE